MTRRWPRARLIEDERATAPYASRAFDPALWRADAPLRVVLIGTDFELRVWETLLSVPMGRATTYSDIACKIGRPTAARAVGAAVGKNPISFVVPCHRVLGRSGALTGYHWGLARKQAIIGWEAGRVGLASVKTLLLRRRPGSPHPEASLRKQGLEGCSSAPRSSCELTYPSRRPQCGLLRTRLTAARLTSAAPERAAPASSPVQILTARPLAGARDRRCAGRPPASGARPRN